MRGASTREATQHHRSVAEPAENLAACAEVIRRAARTVAPHRRIARSLIAALIALPIRGGVVLMFGRRSRSIGRHRGWSRTRRSGTTRLAAAATTTTTRLSVTDADASSASQHGRETKQFESRQHDKTLSEIKTHVTTHAANRRHHQTRTAARELGETLPTRQHRSSHTRQAPRTHAARQTANRLTLLSDTNAQSEPISQEAA